MPYSLVIKFSYMDEIYCSATLKWKTVIKGTNNEWARLPTVKRLLNVVNFKHLIDRERT